MRCSKKNLWLIVGALIFVCIFTTNTKVQAAVKVYNNGQSAVEYNNKLYYNVTGSNQTSIKQYDLKTKKTVTIKKTQGKGNLWIVQNKIYYEDTNGINCMDLKGKNSKVVYRNSKYYNYDYMIDPVKKRIYITTDDSVQHVTWIKETNLSGKVLKERKIPQGECAVVDGKIICGCGTDFSNKKSGIGLYYGTMSKGIKKLASINDKRLQNSDMIVELVGVYGEYAYGYVFGTPGTGLEMIGSVFQVSLKSGKVRICEDKCLVNNCQFVSGKIYAEDMNGGKVKCYQLNKMTGSMKKCIYPEYGKLGIIRGNYIYYESNDSGKKGIIRYDTKSKKKRIMESSCKNKKEFWYGDPNYPFASLELVNGKLFYSVQDCSSGKMMGWRVLPDQTLHYYIDLKSGKNVKYYTEKS